MIRLLVFCLLCLCTVAASAATCTSRQNGNWNQAGQWNCGAGTSNGPPGAADAVVIGHAISLNTSTTVASVTINSGSLIQTGNSNRTLTVSGDFANNGTVDDNGGSGRFDLVVGGNLTHNASTFNVDNLTVTGSTTLSNTFTVNNTFTARGTLTNNSATFDVGALVLDASGAQAVTFYGSSSTVGDLTVNAGALVSSNNYSTLAITGDLVNSGSLSLPSSSFVFSGSSAQLTSGNAFTVLNVTLNNASGLTLGANATVGGVLTLTNGRITTGSSSLILAGNCPASVSGYGATRYVVGNLRMTFPNWSVTCVYPVGTGASGYAPITVAVPYFAGIAGGTLTGTSIAGEHPQIASSGIDSAQNVNRYWNLGVTGDTMNPLPAGGSYNLTLGFVAADVDAGATVSTFKVGVYGSSGWSALAGSASGTAATLNNQTAFGSYAVGPDAPPPSVVSINRSSFDPTTANTVVSWAVTFNRSVTGVDAGDFTLLQSGGAAGASITNVSGSGTTWTVTGNTGTGTSGSVRLNLVDNDSIVSGSTPLGGAGAGNGNFTGQAYTILASTCTGAADILFCDDFERSNPGSVGNGWVVTPANAGNCSGTTGNTGCAGIDSDVPPFSTYANPRPNPTRSMFTRWDTVTVDSPTVNLAGKTGAQLSFWMRRGEDSFSECPEAAGENYLVQYYASNNTWKVLAQYPSSPSGSLCDGKIFTPVIELPDDAFHANFKMRFNQPSGSGDSGSGGAPGVRGYDYWHMDNVVVREVANPTFIGPFCENFEAGLGRWSITAEGAPSGSVIGDASLGTLTSQSPTHSLDLRWGYVVASTFKTDLTGVTGDITYWLRSGTTTDRSPDTGEDLVVEYLNSANTWTALATYSGGVPAGTVYNGLHPLPADAKHSKFRLRFKHLNASGYDKDYWHLDDACVGDLLPVADLAISKVRNGSLVPGTNASYSIVVTNNGPGALSGSIEVTDILPASLSYLGGSGTGWTCSANGQDVTCNWSGTLTAGQVAPTLTLTVAVSSSASGTIANTATVTGTVIDNNAANNSSTDTATLYIPSFVFTDKVCASGVAIGSGATPCNLITWSPQTSGQALNNIYLTAVNSSGIPTQLSASVSTTVNFQFALSCINPTTAAGVQSTFSAVSSALPVCAANGASPTTWSSSVALIFPAATASVGPYSFNYNDVGKVELYVRNASATGQIGQSGEFVVKPAGFVLANIKCTTADAANCGSGALAMPTAGDNPAATTAAGASFIRAGHPFSLNVTAVNANGNATPNYGRESTPETVKLTSSLVAPLDCDGNAGNDPDCNNPVVGGTFSTFTSGVANGSAFTWGNVGIIKLTPSVGDGDYLGAGDVTGTLSANVGRFFPHHFDTEVTPGCSSFTYSEQPFGVKVTARNLAGGVTTNYQGVFARAGTYSDVNGAAGAFTPATLTSDKFALGVADLTAVPDVYFKFTNKFTAASTLKLRLAETMPGGDGVTSADGASEGTTPLRSGRLRLSNTFGAVSPLKMPVEAQYWSGKSWVTATDDACTVTTGIFSASPSAGWGLTPAVLLTGKSDLTITSATPGVTTISGAVPVWLRSRWNGVDGSLPTATATLGIYSPEHKKTIHIRELF